MNASLRALLTHLIDYAGMYPPAQLPMTEAVRNDTEYRNGPDRWMLGRFVCPAAKVAELAVSLPLSVVGRGGKAADLPRAIHEDAEDIAILRQRRPDMEIDVYELRLSSDVLEPLPGDERIAAGMTIFYEVESGHGWHERVRSLVAALGRNTEKRRGLKVRCGGTTPGAVPSAADLAFALSTCRSAGVPVKFTAGLHHPLCKHEGGSDPSQHGFLNVFVAGVLGHARELPADVLRSVIEETDLQQFRFDDDRLFWQTIHATTEEVAAARSQAVISFGSCSFDEPREDLRALGLMK